jgi:CRP-like cAMP-binding protein
MFQQTDSASGLGLRNRFTDQRHSKRHRKGSTQSSNEQRRLVEDLTHKEIAGHSCVYRESVTATLGELRKAGIIAVDRTRIQVLDRVRLERASRE